MAETQRSYAELLVLLASNLSGNISATDVRDMLRSLRAPFGGYYWSSAAETEIVTQSVPVKAAGTTLVTNVRDMTHIASNRLRYDGVSDRHFHVSASFSMTAAGNNKVLGVSIGHNGTEIPGSDLHRKVGTGADVGSTAIHIDVMMEPGEFVELLVHNDTDDTNMTIELGYFFALGMLI